MYRFMFSPDIIGCLPVCLSQSIPMSIRLDVIEAKDLIKADTFVGAATYFIGPV